MDISNNPLLRRYASSEASAKNDWLQLSLMLLLLVLARLAHPLPAHTTLVPRPTLSRYLLPATADSSRFTIYDTRYNTRLMLGRQTSN
ncbi:hypothetical protein [Hymenobacter daeguensis]